MSSSPRAAALTRRGRRFARAAPSVAAALIALRYLALGPAGVRWLAYVDRLFARLGADTAGFFADFVARQEPRYAAHAAALLAHIAGMSIALIVGVVQLVPAVRRHAPALHQSLGWVYALSATLGSACGAYIALVLPMIGSPFAVASNVAAGGLGILFVARALRCAVLGDARAHGQYMLRSYAVLTTLLTLYALVALFVTARMPAAVAYEAAHDLCLPLNMAAVELMLRGKRVHRRPSVGRKA